MLLPLQQWPFGDLSRFFCAALFLFSCKNTPAPPLTSASSPEAQAAIPQMSSKDSADFFDRKQELTTISSHQEATNTKSVAKPIPSTTITKPASPQAEKSPSNPPNTRTTNQAANPQTQNTKAAPTSNEQNTELSKPQQAPNPQVPQPSTPQTTSPEASKSKTTEPPTYPTPQTPNIPTISHNAWDVFLKKHVSASGKVNYTAMKKELTILQRYLDLLAANPPKDDWSKNQKKAYWINAYNAFTVKKILDNFPVKSIQDLDGGKPWDKKWIRLGNATYSLNQIENEILRPTFKDARIHFALNCAAKSCPPLLNAAFLPETLEAQLQNRTRLFVNNADFTRIEGKKIGISKIFDWYAADFGDIKTYLKGFSQKDIPADAELYFLDYDWGLNGN